MQTIADFFTMNTAGGQAFMLATLIVVPAMLLLGQYAKHLTKQEKKGE